MTTGNEDKPTGPGRDILDARAKILSLDDLGAAAQAHKAAGRRVSLAHGVFDLLHMGHVRHLEAARREGDVLFVTVTADAFVNKGPGRPVFPETLRAEMVAAMQYVDGVAINRAGNAQPVIDAIRPSVYVKGSDYRDASSDRTGNIGPEREAVEQHGGRIVFTQDIEFSSSSLINQHLGVLDPVVQEYLERQRGSGLEKTLHGLIDKAAGMKVLLVGDMIIDEYRYVTAMGKSAKESIIATQLQETELFAGGVMAAANHVAALCEQVDVMTMLGTEPSYEEVIRDAARSNVNLMPLQRSGLPTTCKTRFVELGYYRKLFEVYDFDDTPIDGEKQAEINAKLDDIIDDYDVVIVTDFGHGLIQPSTIKLLQTRARFLAVNTQTNSANMGYNLITKYDRADYVCIDSPEAHLAVGDRFTDLETIVTSRLSSLVDTQRIVVTHGKYGCVAYDPETGPKRVPAFVDQAVDTVGAGDAFLAVTSPLVALNGKMEHVGFIGNAVGAMKVGSLGHRHSTDKVQLLRFITTLLK